MIRHFDLNIEKILEGWEVRHAIREIIANALDEQCLSRSADVSITRDAFGAWHIRDFGRGLRYEHLTQNENQEKLGQPGKVIGKFGVGLKDALATLNRHSVKVTMRSRHCDITLEEMSKHDFSDVVTLHAAVSEPADLKLTGTDVSLYGVSDNDIAAAKDFFLRFGGNTILDETPYGQILERSLQKPARICVTGLLVAEEDNFAFSYNITSLTAPMRRALNRERTNVGRTAYTDRVKAMLLASRSPAVANILADDLVGIERGVQHDEVQWTDVAVHACQILNASRKVVFVTAKELSACRDSVDQALADGYQMVAIPENICTSLAGLSDATGSLVRNVDVLQQEQAEQFQFSFVEPTRLTERERAVFAEWPNIAALSGGLPQAVKQIMISEQLRPDLLNGTQTNGLWEPAFNRIIIKRSQLQSFSAFAGTLLHEITHASTGYLDITRDFEAALTTLLGQITTRHLESLKATPEFRIEPVRRSVLDRLIGRH